MNDEKKYTEGISVKDSKFLSWFDNYWYHYKWVTIVVAFALIVFSVCIIQACSNKKADIVITYAGSTYLQVDQKVSVEQVLDKALDGTDDKATVGFKAYYLLTQDQIEQIQKETDSNGHPNRVDTAFNSQEMDNFESQLQTGSGSIIFMDKDMYAMFFGTAGAIERLQPLSEVYGEKPSYAIDDYGIRLGDTAMYQNNVELQRLPEDTIVCLHKKLLVQKDYDKQVEAFKVLAQPANLEKD